MGKDLEMVSLGAQTQKGRVTQQFDGTTSHSYLNTVLVPENSVHGNENFG